MQSSAEYYRKHRTIGITSFSSPTCHLWETSQPTSDHIMANSPNTDALSKELKVTVDSSPLPSPSSLNKELAVTTSELHKAPTATEDYTPNSSNPFSAFYSHPTTRTSFEQLRQSHSHLPPAPPPACQTGSPDLEACDQYLPPPPPGFRPSFDPSMTGASSLGPRKPCTVWPGNEHFRMKRKEMKRSRGCWPLNTMGKWQRRALQVLIVLCIIGLAVGVGVGISLKEGGMINRGANWQAPISSS